MTRAIGRVVAPGGSRGKLLILCYHRVLPRRDPLIPNCIDRAAFDTQMSVVAEHFSPLRMSEALDRLRSGSLPARAIAVTFDDGYADNFEVALPVLRKYSVPATVFIAAGYLDGGRMWNDTITESVRRAPGDALDAADFGLGRLPIRTLEERGAAALRVMLHLRRLPSEQRRLSVDGLAARVNVALPNDLMLSSAQVRGLHDAGVEIGAHTVTHPILARLPDVEAQDEIESARERLEGIVGARVGGFAYPNGVPGVDYHRGHVEAVRRSGYRYAVTTAKGCAAADADDLQLPRLQVWGKDAARFALRVMKEYTSGAGRAV